MLQRTKQLCSVFCAYSYGMHCV